MGSATFQQPSYYRTPPLNVDTSCHGQKFFDDDEILDDDILNQSTLNSALEMSPPLTDSRRDSFAVSATALFSPKSDDSWPPVEMQSVPSNNPFFGQHNSNPFMQMDQNQQSTYQNHWGMMSSGAATPLQSFDGLPQAEYESSTLFRPATVQAQTPFSNPGNQAVMFQQLGHHGMPALPASPPKEPWISQELKNQQAMAKRNRPTTPLIRSHNELRRGDGIRKKNARFDIPAERNLSNIDQLIAQSTDEQEIKELKQQKRLLRNRQAALDSRQRKKQHTERLEDEKKHFTEVITNMEEQMNALQREMEQLLREKQSYEAYISELKNEKEEIIREHTIETGELRKKVNVLTNHVQALESAAMSTPPAGPNVSGFPGAYGEMEGMTMDGSWDNMPMFGEFTMEQQHSEVKQEMQIVPTKKSEVSLSSESEKSPSQGGLLFMLFLVGAFVLSNRSPPSIPRVSEDIRVASATLLDNVLKDAGLPQAASGLEPMAPQPSGANWPQNTGSSLPVAASGMDGVAPSMLGEMADALTQPTEQQTNEQLFGLTAAQYNGISSQDFLQNAPAERSTSKGRRNLAEALASMRAAATKDSAAEVYTRSLLWDKIPRDVVRDFAKMVAESQQVAASNEAEA